MRMRRIFMCGLPRPAVFSPHYLINGKILGKKKWLNTKCLFRFPLRILCESFFFILSWNERDMTDNVYRSSRRHPSFLSDFDETWNLSTESSNTKFHKNPSRWQPSCSTRTDRNDEANSRFFEILRNATKQKSYTSHTHTHTHTHTHMLTYTLYRGEITAIDSIIIRKAAVVYWKGYIVKHNFVD